MEVWLRKKRNINYILVAKLLNTHWKIIFKSDVFVFSPLAPQPRGQWFHRIVVIDMAAGRMRLSLS